MAELKFYTDTHIAKAVATELRKHGVDIVRCEEVGMAEVNDMSHLEYAAVEDRILITNDQGFPLHAINRKSEGKDHAGIFLCMSHLQGQKAIGTIVKECLFYYKAVKEGAASLDEFRNQIIYISFTTVHFLERG